MRNEDILTKNFTEIDARITRAAQNADRSPSEITLIWVSKRKGVDMVTAAAQAGAIHFGENRIQEAIDKFTTPPEGSILHIIGPVQKNKMRKAVSVGKWIHTLSSLEDLERLNNICIEENTQMNVLIQINTSEEESKSGVPHEKAESFLNSLPIHSNLLYCGLMTIGKNSGIPEDSRSEFKFLRTLRDTFNNRDERFRSFTELSMGMTDDMHIAIEEGATMIRIGTALFGARD
ncbi:MAG: YggS family pyridoxal phosphate-dependent enzyme [Fibrobacterales bacterium]